MGYGLEELTTKTDPWTTVEWEILPAMTTVLLPSFRTEGVGVRTVEVGATVHGPDAVGDSVALFDIDRGFLVWSTAKGETCVFVGDAEVERDGRL